MVLVGVVLFGKSISEFRCHRFQPMLFINVPCRIYLERYQQCNTSEEVTVAQEAIMTELEQKYKEARQSGKSYYFT